MKSQTYESDMAVVVGRYATPLAVLLIGVGILLAQPAGRGRKATVALFVFGILFNAAMIRLIKREGAGHGLIMARLFTNVFVNTIIVYILGPYWPPIWLLLALSPLAAGIYSSRADTLKTAGIVSATLLLIHYFKGGSSAAAWGQQGVQCAFIALISLLVNEVSRLGRPQAPANS